MLWEARTERRRAQEVKKKEGVSKGKGCLWLMCDLGKPGIGGDNVERKEFADILDVKFLSRI